MKNSKKFSISDFKQQSETEMLDVNAVKGGTLDTCHIDPEIFINPQDGVKTPPIIIGG